MGKLIDITEQKFGELTVIRFAYPDKHGRSMWECQCSCGCKIIVSGNNLRTGHTKSCGCLKRVPNYITHGYSKSRLYRIWNNMKNRCKNKKLPCAKDYGDRGISVCSEWDNDFSAFRDWALSNGYRADLTLDRIDVNGNYEPGNCRWSTRIEQANNTRRNVIITFNGKSQPLAAWASDVGIKRSTLAERLYSRGWSIERALTEPCHNHKEGR